MRKIIVKSGIISIICVLFCVRNISFFASEENSASERRSIVEVIEEQKDVDGKENIFKKEYYNEDLQGYDFSEDVIMKVYYQSIWCYADLELEEIIEKVEDGPFVGYVALRENPIRIGDYQRNDTTVVELVECYETCPTYLSDIMQSAIYNSKKAVQGENYSKVVCFDDTPSNGNIIVYYVGEENTLVYFYETYTSGPVEYTLQEFQKYGKAYSKYLTSDELNYDENGNFLYGGSKSFATFVEQGDIEKYLTVDSAINVEKYGLLGIVILIILMAVIYMRKRFVKKSEKE